MSRYTPPIDAMLLELLLDGGPLLVGEVMVAAEVAAEALPPGQKRIAAFRINDLSKLGVYARLESLERNGRVTSVRVPDGAGGRSSTLWTLVRVEAIA